MGFVLKMMHCSSMSTSLDHTIHFHRAFRADEWLMFHNETTVSSGGRGVARTEVWSRGGILVASFLQEGLVRPPRDVSTNHGEHCTYFVQSVQQQLRHNVLYNGVSQK